MADHARRPANRPRKPWPRLPDDIVTAARAAGVKPLIYLLRIARDPKADRAERDRMTAIAVQYLRGGRP